MDLTGKLGWLRNFPEVCFFFFFPLSMGYISLGKENTVPNYLIIYISLPIGQLFSDRHVQIQQMCRTPTTQHLWESGLKI